jgi:hypothetical protein
MGENERSQGTGPGPPRESKEGAGWDEEEKQARKEVTDASGRVRRRGLCGQKGG